MLSFTYWSTRPDTRHKELKMNKQDKARISQLITDLYSGVAIALDPTNAKDKAILSNLRGDISALREALELN